VCFSLGWIAQLIIWLIIVLAVVAIVRLLVPFVLSKFGDPGGAGTLIVSILTIVMWALICIAVVTIVFDLLACLLGAGGGLHLPRSR